jgi:hypothetical protein
MSLSALLRTLGVCSASPRLSKSVSCIPLEIMPPYANIERHVSVLEFQARFGLPDAFHGSLCRLTGGWQVSTRGVAKRQCGYLNTGSSRMQKRC